MIADQELAAYDSVVYPGRPFRQSHPDRLATLASLYGMTPAPVPSCSVLELGCGSGRNLIPMAYQYPESHFLGVDLSRGAVETGVGAIGELGLRNIQLRHLDIMDVTGDLGRFDYIIAHGVYSWVPPVVRAKILDVFHTNLAPHGVAYVSYNTYPGAFLSDLARRMMLFHVRAATDAHDKIQQSRALLTFLAEASPDDQIYGLVLRAQLERIRAKPDAVFFHDDLEEASSPFFLYEVVGEAVRHGLQYLADATSPVVDLRMHPNPVVRVLERIPEREVMIREQYLDFISGRGFRHTLLCHEGVELHRSIGPACVKNYHLAARIDLAPGTIDPLVDVPAEFNSTEGTLTTDHRLSKAALLHLGEIWPRAVTFHDLLEDTLVRLAQAAHPIRDNLDEEVEALSTVLFQAFAAGQVTLHLHPPRWTTTISDRPEASLVARQQAKTDSIVTNLSHGAVLLNDEVVRRFLMLVDGTRNLEQLVSDLNAAVTDNGPSNENGGGECGRPALTRESVEGNLALLARLALLVA